MPPIEVYLSKSDVLPDARLSREAFVTPCGTYRYVLNPDRKRSGGIYYTQFRIVSRNETRLYEREFLVLKWNNMLDEWVRRHEHFIVFDKVNYESKVSELASVF
jgi:hypothetical protein